MEIKFDLHTKCFTEGGKMKTYRIDCVDLKKDWESGYIGAFFKTGLAEVRKFLSPLSLHYVQNGQYWTAFGESEHQYFIRGL